MNYRSLLVPSFPIPPGPAERAAPFPKGINNREIMHFVSYYEYYAKPLFEVTNRQYEIILIDPRGVCFLNCPLTSRLVGQGI